MAYGKKKEKISKVQTSIPAGDNSMQEGSDFQVAGAGVVEKEVFLGSDPNAGLQLIPELPGKED